MKALKALLFACLLSFLVFTVYADSPNQLVYQYLNPEITVVFSDPLEVSEERQLHIANEIAGVSSNSFIPPANSPNNIICTIFGHDLAPQVSVTATHHKVKVYNPRCLMEVYHVTYCKRCDYTLSELYNDFYIVCCPED